MPNRRMAVNSREYTKDEERWIRYGSAPLLATLLLPIIIGVILLLKCVFNHCCVRKTTTKDEMYGLEGRVTMLSTADSSFVTINDARNDTHQQHTTSASSIPLVTEVTTKNVPQSSDPFNVIRSDPGKIVHTGPSSNSSKADQGEITPCSSSYEDNRIAIELRRSSETSKLASSQGSSDLCGSLKRASAQHRQLPDLPQTPLMTIGSGARPPRRSSSVLSHDGTSELYATVGETPFPERNSSKTSNHYAQIRNGAIGAGKSLNNNSTVVDSGLMVTSSVPGGPVSGPVVRPRGIEATPSSDSETYASSSSHHPYAKLKKNPPSAEHPYARVRAMGASNNDEETDTDNYDMPQFLREDVGIPSSIPVPSTSRPMTSPPIPVGVPQTDHPSGSGAAVVSDANGPVPPRRIGRPWRRSSQPNLQNDNVSNFSGDSQDSRGYTSISVREPLSNLRNQLATNTRSFDSHYATVSDDSEEMYAAIDDPNDANYMRIDGDGQPRRPTWLGGPNVASPIPERREANSPLPPVPNVPIPIPELAQQVSTSGNTIPAVPTSPNSSVKNSGLPVYAQVTKKSKKAQQAKVPVTPTLSNVSTCSSQQVVREPITAVAFTSESTTAVKENTISSSTSHHQTHRSKRAASLMDNTNPMDADSSDSRRWSKADISYSEFEVVRENIFPKSSGGITSPGSELKSPGPSARDVIPVLSSPPISTRQTPGGEDLVDEDNYNIIPEKLLRNARSGDVDPSSSASSRNRLDSGNYQIIDHNRLSNSYREMEDSSEHCDHYQEINDRRNDEDERVRLYQEIHRVKRNPDEDEDEDDEDEFYESVKKPPSSTKGKKHGYEKIKKKNIPGNLSNVKPAYESDEDDEDDERPDELYERVKYPPYERLKESKDNLYDDSEDGKSKSDYEDIGYSRVKSKKQQIQESNQEEIGTIGGNTETSSYPSAAANNIEDVSQLYAQVDKTKKRKGISSTLPLPSSRTVNSNTLAYSSVADNTVHDIYVNNNEPCSKSHFGNELADEPEHLYSKVAKSNKSDKNKNKHSVPPPNPREQSDGSIEYL